MKTIGIFTYKHSNYGAVLQCYALQQYLRNHSDNQVQVVDFTTDTHYRQDRYFKKRSNNPIKQLAYVLLTLFRFPALLKRRQRTKTFKDDNIRWTSLYSSESQLLSNPPKFDVYCTGSDQVFNLSGEYKDVYYLHFNTFGGRKVAYAPSFGSSVFDAETKEEVSLYVKDFQALSCRENDGAEFLSKVTGTDVPVVLDPTLLLTKEDWLAVAHKPSSPESYILVYDLNGGKNLITIAKKVKERYKLPIVCITDKIEAFYHIDRQIYGAGPAEFVGWFANAEFVITDSFHGTVFSIIFSKPFISYIAIPRASSRIISLLNNLGLAEHIVTKDNLTDVNDDALNGIDVESKLNALKSNSFEYINKNILQ